MMTNVSQVRKTAWKARFLGAFVVAVFVMTASQVHAAWSGLANWTFNVGVKSSQMMPTSPHMGIAGKTLRVRVKGATNVIGNPLNLRARVQVILYRPNGTIAASRTFDFQSSEQSFSFTYPVTASDVQGSFPKWSVRIKSLDNAHIFGTAYLDRD
jgi:hypothetical protein